MSVGWMLIRGSGLTAYALLAAATIWGLLASTKVLGATRTKSVTWFHESLSLGALVATGVHMVALALHDYMPFSVSQLLVPGVSSFKPLGVAWGVMAFYAILALSISFYVKRLIGQSAWRVIHYGAFGAFAAASLHGITVGTDSSNPAVIGLYVGSVSAVVLLTAIRLLAVSVTRSGAGRSRQPVEGARLRAVGPIPQASPRTEPAGEVPAENAG